LDDRELAGPPAAGAPGVISPAPPRGCPRNPPAGSRVDMALPPIFDPIVNAPRPQKLVAGALGAIVIVVAAYFLLLAPAQADVAQLRAQLSSLQSEITRNRAIVADLLKYRREAAELEARLNALKDRLPGEKEIPPLYRTVSDGATASGLGVALFQPRPPVVRDYYSEIPITVNAEAGYHQFG